MPATSTDLINNCYNCQKPISSMFYRCTDCAKKIADELAGFKGTQRPDPSIEINEAGGKQSHLPGLYTKYPKAMARIATICKKGNDKYGEGNFLLISTESHINHALHHIYQHLLGDSSEEHLYHAAVRLAMAIEVEDNDQSK